MEEIPKGHDGPVGEEQGQRGAGDRKIIKESSHDFCLLDHIKGDQQNVDAAKVEGKITPTEFPQNDQDQIFDHFQQEDAYTQTGQHDFLLAAREIFIENAGGNA